MPAQNSSAGGVASGLLGILGLGVVAGLLVTVMVAPAVAVTGIAANSTVGVFDSLPPYIRIDTGYQKNTFAIEVPVDDAHPNGLQTVATIYNQNRQEIPLDQMSPFLIDAAIAGEDKRFYEHNGVDAPSVVRAGVGWITGTSESGASTIEMQLVRNSIQQSIYTDDSLTQEQKDEKIQAGLAQDPARKIQEMKYAIGLDKRFTKDEILQAYLNIANFGANTYGVQAAALQYFSKSAKDLTVAEAASLIAIVQFPGANDLKNPDHFAANQQRRDYIIRAMYDTERITAEQRDEALAIPVDENFVHYSAPSNGCIAAQPASMGYACDYARRSINELESLGSTAEDRAEAFTRGGYTFVLTVDPVLQDNANAIANQYAPGTETRFNLGAAVSSVRVGTGEILALGQNTTFDDSKESDNIPGHSAIDYNSDFKHGGGTGFQPGSSYKPYVLLAFLNAGHGINETYNASVRRMPQSAFNTCEGVNVGADFRFGNDQNEQGLWTVARATANSVNAIFIQMAAELDQCDIRSMAQSLGVHRGNGAADGSDLKMYPSCVIGTCDNSIAPLTQAAAYAAIANQGVFCKPIIIKKVIDPDGQELPGQDAECGQSLASPGVANTAAYAMKGAVTSGTATASNPRDGTEYIAKTGTTDHAYQTWMVGSSTAVSTAVWVGNVVARENGTEQNLRSIAINGINASVLRHRIFKPYAQIVDQRYPAAPFPAPDQGLLNGSPVTVPDGLVGQPLEAVKSAIELSKLSFTDGGQIDSYLDAGLVAQVTPGSGEKVARGTEIVVYTSNGMGATVPDVVSNPMTFNQAENAFHNAGFTNVTQLCQEPPPPSPGDPVDPVTPGTVVKQNLQAGTVANKTTEVKLTVRQVSCP